MVSLINWTPAAQKQLKPALRTSTHAIRREVMNGHSKLWSFNHGELLAVTRLEGREFVVVAVAGRNLKLHKYELVRLGKQSGAITARFHTKQPEKLLKSVQGLPIQLTEVRRKIGKDEYVYRVFL